MGEKTQKESAVTAAPDEAPLSGRWVDMTPAEAAHGRFAGWGSAEKITDFADTPPPSKPAGHAHHKLGELAATAICGNDITSSVLYVGALCTLVAGIYAPVALATVGLTLYLFRKIYAEAVTALPLNGGAYNVLLNTTSKGKASVAACLTLLSYVATAVISANEAIHYAHHVFHWMPIMAGTVALLGVFALLNLIGISESAVVAVIIFVLHISTLIILTFTSSWSVFKDGFHILMTNWATRPTEGLGKAIFLGFATGLLGISGFESSANFIEEQKPGVFPKTLRNMWVAVSVFNPLITFLALGVLTIPEFSTHKTALLSELGNRSAGGWLKTWVSIDAFLVLSGAVLTSYVGVTGLVRRMSLDRCLPQFLLRENRARGTSHWIIISFFFLCCSIFFITKGKVESLAGVYTLSFLGVMTLFAVGNRLLAVKRGRLPRAARATWPMAIVATIAVLIGLVGNAQKSPEDAKLFAIYFAVAMSVVGGMLYRDQILQVMLYVGGSALKSLGKDDDRFAAWIKEKVDEINDQSIVFFTRGDSLANLRRAVEYVLQNELTRNIKVVHVYQDEATIPEGLSEQLQMLDRVFPEIRIDCVLVQGKFGPTLIDQLSERLSVPRNYMFIGCPGDRFPHNLGDLGGVRLIV